MENIIEIMKVKMKPGVTRQQVIAAGETANALFRRMPGLRQRILAGPDDKGVWTEICEFVDEKGLDAARKQAKEEPGEAKGYFDLVDMESMQYERLPADAIFKRAS